VKRALQGCLYIQRLACARFRGTTTVDFVRETRGERGRQAKEEKRKEREERREAEGTRLLALIRFTLCRTVNDDVRLQLLQELLRSLGIIQVELFDNPRVSFSNDGSERQLAFERPSPVRVKAVP